LIQINDGSVKRLYSDNQQQKLFNTEGKDAQNIMKEAEKMEKSESVKHVDDNTFEAQVLKSDKPVLVDFWAPWCGPCRALGPVLEEVARQYGDKVNVVKVNVDENPKTSSQYGVRSIPTILVIKDGQVRETKVGMQTKNHLTALVDRNLN